MARTAGVLSILVLQFEESLLTARMEVVEREKQLRDARRAERAAKRKAGKLVGCDNLDLHSS